jgi:hypothetical protein
MDENEYCVAGYRFSDAHDYKEAKREAETVDYIKKNTDLKDINKVLKLYHKLIERKTLRTVIGFVFLNELRDKIIQSGIISEDKLPKIHIEKVEQPIKIYDNAIEREQEKKHMELIAEFKVKLRNSRIISVFLAVIILVMIAISIFSDRSMYSIYENQVIDKYESWQADLEAREAALEQKESTLEASPNE